MLSISFLLLSLLTYYHSPVTAADSIEGKLTLKNVGPLDLVSGSLSGLSPKSSLTISLRKNDTALGLEVGQNFGVSTIQTNWGKYSRPFLSFTPQDTIVFKIEQMKTVSDVTYKIHFGGSTMIKAELDDQVHIKKPLYYDDIEISYLGPHGAKIKNFHYEKLDSDKKYQGLKPEAIKSNAKVSTPKCKDGGNCKINTIDFCKDC